MGAAIKGATEAPRFLRNIHQWCAIASVLGDGCRGIENHLGSHGWRVRIGSMGLAADEIGEILAVPVLAVNFGWRQELILILLQMLIPLALGAFIFLNLGMSANTVNAF